jgi:hypothetical protein
MKSAESGMQIKLGKIIEKKSLFSYQTTKAL